MADELLPPGEYDTIEEAQRAAGFNIPHARDLGGWRLQSIAVSGPEYGIIGEGEDADIANLRIASLTYRREVGEREAWVTAYLANGDVVQPVQGADLRSGRRSQDTMRSFSLTTMRAGHSVTCSCSGWVTGSW